MDWNTRVPLWLALTVLAIIVVSGVAVTHLALEQGALNRALVPNS